jgi:predicted DNA-binding protein (MmcQ/YjbR family)
MFCIGDINDFQSISLKCNPEKALELREAYEQIIPGFHLNKSLWNTVYLEGLNLDFVFSLIEHSYEEVVQKLPKKIRLEITNK